MGDSPASAGLPRLYWSLSKGTKRNVEEKAGSLVATVAYGRTCDRFIPQARLIHPSGATDSSLRGYAGRDRFIPKTASIQGPLWKSDAAADLLHGRGPFGDQLFELGMAPGVPVQVVNRRFAVAELLAVQADVGLSAGAEQREERLEAGRSDRAVGG